MTDVLTIRDLKVYLKVDGGTVKAVDGVSFRIPQGRTVALVGESGSGKSVIAQTIMGILPKIARIESGEVLFADPRTPGVVVDISRLHPDSEQMRDIRGARISIIFQEPMTALSPVHTIAPSAIRSTKRCTCTAIWSKDSTVKRRSICCDWSVSTIPRRLYIPIRSNFRAASDSVR